MGWHEHHPFRLDVELLSVKGLPDSKKKYSFKASTSRHSSKCYTDDPRNFTGMCSVNIRQADSHVKLHVYEQGAKDKHDYGTLMVDLDHLLQTNDTFPLINKQFPLVRADGKQGVVVTCNVFISMDTSVRPGLVAVLNQAVKKTKERAEKTGKRLKTDIPKMGYLERVRFVSRALDGPVWKAGFGGIEKLSWLRVVETSNGKFELQMFSWKADRNNTPLPGGPSATDKPDLKVQVLSVAAVIPSAEFEDNFAIKIIEKADGGDAAPEDATGKKGDKQGKVTVLELRKADMPRDAWVEGFYDFLQRLRAFKKAKRDGTLEDLDVDWEMEAEALAAAAIKSPIYEGVDRLARKKVLQEAEDARMAKKNQLAAQRRLATGGDDDDEYDSDEEMANFALSHNNQNDDSWNENTPLTSSGYFQKPVLSSSNKKKSAVESGAASANAARRRAQEADASLPMSIHAQEGAGMVENERLKRMLGGQKDISKDQLNFQKNNSANQQRMIMQQQDLLSMSPDELAVEAILRNGVQDEADDFLQQHGSSSAEDTDEEMLRLR